MSGYSIVVLFQSVEKHFIFSKNRNSIILKFKLFIIFGILLLFNFTYIKNLPQNITQALRFFYIRQVKGVGHWKITPPERISNYLKKRINKTDYIYVVNYEPTLIYFLSGAKVPTKYPIHSQVLGLRFRSIINPIRELDKVMLKKPKYLIISYRNNDIKQKHNQEYKEAIENYLESFYFLEKSINGHYLYRLNGYQ